MKWFMNQFLSEEDEVYWLLEDMITDSQVLQRLQFVKEIDEYPKGIIISTFDDERPFVFKKGTVTTDNVYTAFHELHLYDQDQIFVQVHFPQADSNRLYQILLKEEQTNQKRDRVIATFLLEHLLRKERKSFIMKEIDRALDEQDYEKFIHYSNLLKKEIENEEHQS